MAVEKHEAVIELALAFILVGGAAATMTPSLLYEFIS